MIHDRGKQTRDRGRETPGSQDLWDATAALVQKGAIFRGRGSGKHRRRRQQAIGCVVAASGNGCRGGGEGTAIGGFARGEHSGRGGRVFSVHRRQEAERTATPEWSVRPPRTPLTCSLSLDWFFRVPPRTVYFLRVLFSTFCVHSLYKNQGEVFTRQGWAQAGEVTGDVCCTLQCTYLPENNL